ncbi:MAG: UvrD-helicase domain-containing protein [Bacillales bacterium]|nr:UvrD-helicase domain-containing protein [Bacillales bacterium]
MKDYLMKLNDNQLKACTDSIGPSLIIAGAGSGKTRVLTYKIAYIIDEMNVNPYEILAITFTNKAAKEMKTRLYNLIGNKRDFVNCATFHSFCAQVLRKEIEVIPGRKRSFQIIDDDETETLVKEAMVELNQDIKLVKPKLYASSISALKSELATLSSFDKYYAEKLEPVYRKYEDLLIKNNLLDFDDLILHTINIFRSHPEILSKYQEMYKYILVDEFQDTSNIQYDLIKMLGEKYENVFIVGDEDQSIYSFRGANIENIRKFMRDFPNYKKFVLDQNYRSTKNILDCANTLIKKNKNRIPKDLWTDSKGGEEVKMDESYSDKSEARDIADEIKRLYYREGYEYKDIAILYRNNFLSRNFEDEFIKDKIPYRIYSGLSFYKRKEVKDMISYLRLSINPDDFYAFKRVINSPRRGIGESTIEKIEAVIDKEEISLSEAIEKVEVYKTVKETLSNFRSMIISLSQELDNKTLEEFFNLVYLRSGYKAYIDSLDEDERKKRQENIDELFNSISEVETLGSTLETLIDYLQNVTLKTDEDIESSDENHVSMMTMHSAKGLEFKIVFAVCLENDIIPGYRADKVSLIEEERRLFYVAVTRAKERLYLSYSDSRYKYGKMNHSEKSVFLDDLEIHSKRKKEISLIEEKPTPPPSGAYSIGDRVNHKINGDGVILAEIEGFYIILFDNIKTPKKVIVNHPLLKKV